MSQAVKTRSSNVPLLPDDEHDRLLARNVRPADWANPVPAARYNLVVLGAGTAGLVAAAGAAGLGAKVALVEQNLMGGDCLNVGCVPSKAVIRASRAAADLGKAHRFGVRIPDGVEVDFASVMERMRRLRARISHHDSARRFRDLGVDVFLGEARFAGSHVVEVDGKRLCFKKAVIATGGRAIMPPIEGLAEAGVLTNESVFSLTGRPERFMVVGGGPLGLELAQAFARLGSEVSVVEVMPQFLPREDPDAAEVLREAMSRDGVRLRLSTQVTRIETNGPEKVVHLERDNGEKETLRVDEILMGVGRVPNVEGLNLEAAGVEYDPSLGVKVDDKLRTTGKHIYAAGDVCLPHKFTHTADAAARIVIQNALFLGRKRVSALTIPWVTYTDPEVAHVGMYEKDAKAKGIPVKTFVQELADVDRAILDGEEEGFVKVHVKEGTDRILGATIVATHAGEMISEITLAMVHGIGLGSIASVIHPYPTQAEAIRKAGDAYNRTRLTATVKWLFSRWLGWTR